MANNSTPRTNLRAGITAENEAEFLKAVRTVYHKDLRADEHNIEPGREDMRFVIGDQWDASAKARRTRLRKPVITVNRLPAFVAQYIGSWLQSDTTMKLVPTRGGTKSIAEIRQGIIRTITRENSAKVALQKAMESSYICGQGNFAVEIVDSTDDVFLRDIKLQTLEDPFQVIWDRSSKDPTGADANHCTVMEYMERDDFDAAYPDYAGDSGWYSDDIDSTVQTQAGIATEDMVRIAKFWQMKDEPVFLGLEAGTGDVIDLEGMTEDEIRLACAPDENGDPITRHTKRKYAECHVLTATNVLEGPYRLDISRVPVFRAIGWNLTEASVNYRWGFVRNAKDPQRIHNYWRSVLAEELGKSAASKWLIDRAGGGADTAETFRQQHLSGDNVLEWDSAAGGAKPEQMTPPIVNNAVITEAEMSVRDIKDVTNRHEASMGGQSNEVSGKAISARQRVSELGDVIYTDNMNMALAEAAKVINELIPAVYDTHRTVKVTGEDDQAILREINNAANDDTPDVTRGKYDLTYSTGPSYATKRQESSDLILTLMNTMPQTGNVLADIIVRNMDIAGADEIEERLASLLPEGMLDLNRIPEERRKKIEAQMEAKAQAAQKQEAMTMAQFEGAMAKMQAEISELRARGMRSEAQALREASEIGLGAGELDVKQDKVLVDAAKVGLDGLAKDQDAFAQGMQTAAQFKAEKDQINESQREGKSGTQESNEGGPQETG